VIAARVHSREAAPPVWSPFPHSVILLLKFMFYFQSGYSNIQDAF
jgi:hypothetical protein